MLQIVFPSRKVFIEIPLKYAWKMQQDKPTYELVGQKQVLESNDQSTGQNPIVILLQYYKYAHKSFAVSEIKQVCTE